MKLDQLNYQLNEGVAVHGIELFAYAVTIGEMYLAAPDYDPQADKYWTALLASNDKLAQRFLGHLKITYSEDDPYDNMNDLVRDVVLNHRLVVFKSAEVTNHPGMTNQQNDIFRTLHDALAHVGANIDDFLKFVAKHGPEARYKPLSNNFTVRGEMNAYVTHARVAPPEARPALFVEIVGQICTYFLTDNYTTNKVFYPRGCDIKNVGVLHGSLDQRKQQIIQEMNDPSIEVIKTSYRDIHKDHIRWKLLSKGTGAGQIT